MNLPYARLKHFISTSPAPSNIPVYEFMFQYDDTVATTYEDLELDLDLDLDLDDL